MPAGIGQFPFDGLPPVGKAVLRMLPDLFLQDPYRVFVQRYASRRSILCLIQPGGTPFQLDPVPLQPGNLSGPASGRQGKTRQGCQMRRASSEQLVRFFAREPAVALDLSW